MAKGLIIGGGFGELLARQKAGAAFELGELFVAGPQGGEPQGGEPQGGNDGEAGQHLLQVFDLLFASQLGSQQLEFISGMLLEEGAELSFLDPHARDYTIARLKSLATLGDAPRSAKSLPPFFGELREVTAQDIPFTHPPHPLQLGRLRSGSRVLDVPVAIDGAKAISHHILIPATTGRGKSNLVKCMLWSLAHEDYAGMLVLDPHDEYFSDNTGLRTHPRRERFLHYSPTPPAGSTTLRFNIRDVRPEHFNGAAAWSGPQHEALTAYWKLYGDNWVEAVVLERELDREFHKGTLGVVRRRVMDLLSLTIVNGHLHSEGVFVSNGGATTINDICAAVMAGKIVIIDTSSFDGREEILIGSLIVTELFRRYRQAKTRGTLHDLPVAGIVLEEAPRVLGKDVLERGRNIFSTLAREGRKFKVGLVAITQLPSLIPRQVLANMNTKIILGLEMGPERQAIIESAAQDLSQDARAIAALDRGEAIVTSTFVPFALPLKIPLFSELSAAPQQAPRTAAKHYLGLQATE